MKTPRVPVTGSLPTNELVTEMSGEEPKNKLPPKYEMEMYNKKING